MTQNHRDAIAFLAANPELKIFLPDCFSTLLGPNGMQVESPFDRGTYFELARMAADPEYIEKLEAAAKVFAQNGSEQNPSVYAPIHAGTVMIEREDADILNAAAQAYHEKHPKPKPSIEERALEILKDIAENRPYIADSHGIQELLADAIKEKNEQSAI